MNTLLKNIAAAILTCSVALATSTASAESLFSVGSRFSIEFEDSLFVAPSQNSHKLYDDQLYRDGNIRKGNLMHTTLDLAYHYAVRKMSKKMRTRSLHATPENTHVVTSRPNTSYRVKVSSHKVVFGIKYRF